ncbi:MAG: hypothetical protein WAQ52_08725 [Terriglobales bacterium]
MTLDFWDTLANEAALKAFAGELEIEDSRMFMLLDRYFSDTAHDEAYLETFAEAAPRYIERSLKALNLDWESLRLQLKKTAAILAVNDPDEAERIEAALKHEAGNVSNRASMLVTIVWPMLRQTVTGAQKIGEKFGYTPEAWSKLDLTEQSRAYALAKKEGRL